MAIELLPAGTDAAVSSACSLNAGQSATVWLKDASGDPLASTDEVGVDIKLVDDLAEATGGLWKYFPMAMALTPKAAWRLLQGPLKFAVSRRANTSVSCGVNILHNGTIVLTPPEILDEYIVDGAFVEDTTHWSLSELGGVTVAEGLATFDASGDGVLTQSMVGPLRRNWLYQFSGTIVNAASQPLLVEAYNSTTDLWDVLDGPTVHATGTATAALAPTVYGYSQIRIRADGAVGAFTLTDISIVQTGPVVE